MQSWRISQRRIPDTETLTLQDSYSSDAEAMSCRLGPIAPRCREQVGGVSETGGRVIFVTDAAKTERFQQAFRRSVVRVMPGEQRRCAKDSECVIDHRSGRLMGVSLSLVFGEQVDPDLIDSLVEVIRAEAAATGELAGREEKDRPVLNTVSSAVGDLRRKALVDLVGREGTTDQSRDLGVAPETMRELDIR